MSPTAALNAPEPLLARASVTGGRTYNRILLRSRRVGVIERGSELRGQRGRSGMAELIWDGKYVDGKRQAPVRVALPFQTIET